MLMTLAQYPEVQNGDVQACNTLFQNLLRQSPYHGSIVAAGSDGTVFAAGEANTSFNGVLDDGINFLQKPFSPKTLAEKIRDVLET